MALGILIILTALGVMAGWFAVSMLLRPGTGLLAPVVPLVAVGALAPLVASGGNVPPLGGFAVALAGVPLGWLAASYALFKEPDRTPERLMPIAQGAPRQLGVIYFTHGEPATYEPEPWINMLYELDHTVPSFPPKPVWPFILAGIRRSFDTVIESPHGRIHEKTMEAARHALGRDDVSWHLSFLDADPPLRETVAQAARCGVTDMVFLTVFLTDSDHTAEADELDQAMGLSEAGVRFHRTSVLWDDPRLARMIADKVLAAAAARDRSEVGVMLVGHGQPHEWDRLHPTETEQEQKFREAIRALLIDEGFRPELVSDAWMSFREPKVPGRVRELARNGARTVIGVPVTISADSLHSLHDTPRLVRKGARGTDLEVIDVGGWNTEPLLVEILAEKTRAALAELERP